MRSLNKREKTLLIIAIVLFGGFSIFNYFLAPAYSSYQELGEERKELEENLQIIKMDLMEKEDYEEKLIYLEREVEILKEGIYDTDLSEVRLDFIDNVDEKVQYNNLQVRNKDISIQQPQEEGFLTTLNYRLTFEGNLMNVLRFLNDLLGSEKLYRVRELEIQASPQVEELSVFIIIQAYCKEGEINEEMEL